MPKIKKTPDTIALPPDSQKKDYIFAVGRRKEAVARVRLYTGSIENLAMGETPIKKGEIVVNGLPVSQYFYGEAAKALYSEVLRTTNTLDTYAISAKVEGGGKSSQLKAVVLGIARALDTLDREKHHSTLRRKGFLTRDSRIRQRRKIGMGGKSRRKKQSPKR